MADVVHLRPAEPPKPDLVLRCTRCGHDVGIRGNTQGLHPDTYICIECLVAAADPEPRVGNAA